MNKTTFILSATLLAGALHLQDIGINNPKAFEKQEEVQYQQMFEEKYFDEEFIKLAKLGEIKDIPIKLGSSIKELKNRFDLPFVKGEGEGSYSLIADEASFHYPAIEEGNENAPITGIEFVIHDTLIDDMIKDLGKPLYDGVDNMTGLRTTLHEFGNYELWTTASKDNYIQTILLKNKS